MVAPIAIRGFGSTPRIITRGFGTIFVPAVVTAVRQVFGGTKKKIKEYHEDIHHFTVMAMLIAVNDQDLLNPKQGESKGELVDSNISVKAVFKAITRLGYLTERIIINAFRVVRRGLKKIGD